MGEICVQVGGDFYSESYLPLIQVDSSSLFLNQTVNTETISATLYLSEKSQFSFHLLQTVDGTRVTIDSSCFIMYCTLLYLTFLPRTLEVVLWFLERIIFS